MVIYNSGDSELLIQTLTDNLKSSKEIFDKINRGTQHLNSVIDSGTLSGAAYRAGQSLFQTYIAPMIQKLDSAISDIQGDLDSYKKAEQKVRTLSSHLDEALLTQKLDNTNRLIQLIEQKMEEDKKVIQKFISSGFEGVASGLAELPGLDGQLNNLKELKHDYEKKLCALQEFSSSTNSLFTDSLQAFKYALQGVEVINQSRASVNGTITFPPGADMSWSSKLQNEVFSSKLSKIKNNKSDKIEMKWVKLNGLAGKYPQVYVNGKLDKSKTEVLAKIIMKLRWKEAKDASPELLAELLGYNDFKVLNDPDAPVSKQALSFLSLLLTYFPATKAAEIYKAFKAAKMLEAGGDMAVDLAKISKATRLTAKESKALEDIWKSNKIITKAKFGDDFGKAGTYVEHPDIKVDWKQSATHASERMSERGLSEEQIDNIVKNGKALSQNGGAKYLFVTKDGVAVVSKEGKMVTAWSKADFDESMNDIIAKLYGE
ncbi:DUF4258 domain-containing protein [Lactococcus lactis subsp. lactis]|uniref:DUF4258 domain-containing protein n=1 Tax=Lactococcus lactis TaxID=1358 RepID=UPI00223C06FB|nr:DUF4258 domain-containing protein [Lactococcus lactis]MCT0015473.1 DUF4258 domain-containing protein [Lactococcus lactis subsp. lactis]